MATNFNQPGDIVQIAAPYNVASGGPVMVGGLFGIALTDATTGGPVNVALSGGWFLPTAATFTQGASVAFDPADKAIKAPGSGRAVVGVALAATAGGRVLVRLGPPVTVAA
ncbi:MAG: hypothetical protein RLY86_858 [Pseudomonadota bacterium]|jgi:predicted RecA/RadA family phage recombinase